MKKNRFFQRLKLMCLSLFLISNILYGQNWNPNYSIGTVDGKYNFSYNQTPSQLVEIYQAAFPNTGLTYQWESSALPTSGFTSISGATSGSYSIPGPLSQTKYYRRKSTYTANGAYIYSNIIKISVVSVNWEDINYIREHDVITTGITSWTAVDQLTIGQKLQTTTYLDGLGRTLEKVSRETATPPSNPNDTWGDIVQFSQYDQYGREPVKYLPYTTTTQSGKYKTTPLTEQTPYYTNTYNETSAYSTVTFDNSPLNRVTNVKEPGTSWASAPGLSADYDMNTDADDVIIFTVDYIQGNPPVQYSYYYSGVYPANSLYKLTYTDENGKQVVEFINISGQLILKKVQLDNTPSGPYTGWICTYNVYDDFGLLRYQIQPEGVKYLAANSWSFAGTYGQTILAEQVFQYNYDDKGRNIWKKAPGASPLNMIYDARDRVVFMQDGNQANPPSGGQGGTPQWTANLYDELDRPVLSTLYNTSETIANLQTDINNAASTSTVTVNNSGTASVTVTLSLDPISSANLNNTAVCTPLKYLFYDNYSFPLVKSFNTTYTNTNAYNNSDPNVIAIAKSLRTTDFPTGSMTRVLGATTFLASTNYYDEKGHPIQTLEDNLKTGVDINTLQYHFDGRLLSVCSDHTTPGTGYTNFQILTKNIFDKLGRITSIQKQYGSNAMKTISSYDYDDVGRIKKKTLDPDFSPPSGGAGLESLNYSFNIHNQIIGINKDYALKTPATYNKWGHFFGMYLGYDNRDAVFTNAQLNGQVTGTLWNTQGDDAQRRYDYTYDNAGRLIAALFKEQPHPGDGWANNKMDFSVSNISYDNNGNLLTMLQKGVLPGTTAPVNIDDLQYTYNLYSNKLSKVTDNTPLQGMGVNGTFGDFKDGTNGSNPDYVYDANGNVVIDLNKNAKDLNNVVGANGIHYNFLDKPDQIRIAGKGTINIVYSADGEKLQRSFTSEADNTVKTTTYIHQFIYEETKTTSGTVISPLGVKGINFEEGRIRIINPTSTNNGYDALTVSGNLALPTPPSGGWGAGAFDYYITDYQENVRMILTEETHVASNTCTMETTRAAAEDPVFGQTGSSNEVETTRYAKPSGWTGNTSSSVSRLGNNALHNIGPNVLQKVMAGDSVSATVQYYFQTASNNSNPNFVSNLLSSLVQTIGSSSATTGIVKGQASNISTQLNGSSAFTSAVQPAGSGGTTPQAWLTILFFDERFNFIASADGGVAQQQVTSSVGSNGATLGLMNIKAPKNGYVYIYVSNRSDQDVYFDNLLAGITAGNIIEENHFYSFGLRIATISSKKLADAGEGTVKNNYLYNDKELFDDGDLPTGQAGLNWYDYGFRNYDPQIGRFTQLDPLAFEFSFLTPYQYASNDPIGNIDMDGLEGTTALNTVASGVKDFSYAYDVGSKISMEFIQITHAVTGVTSVVTKTSALLKVGELLGMAVKAGQMINNFSKTRGVGNVSESTNPYRPGQLAAIRSGAYLTPEQKPWEPPVLSACTHCGNMPEISNDQKTDPYVSIIRKETVEKLSNSPSDELFSFIGLRNLIVAGRMELGGFHKEAGSSLKKSPGEMSLMILPFGEIAEEGIQFTRSSLKFGRKMHTAYKAGLADGVTTFKEFTKVPGIRPDFVDFGTKTIFELKPFNPRQIQLGTKQLNNYKSLFEQKYGGTWKTVLDHY